MRSMTTEQHTPARDRAGRFTSDANTSPEVSLEDLYLEDTTDVSDYDVHEFYDALRQDSPDGDSFETGAERQHDEHQQRTAEFPPGAETGFDTGHTLDEEEAFRSWLEEQRTPQGIDEQFDRPDPTLLPVPHREQITIGAWGNATPF